MSSRQVCHVKANPLAGDVIEITERQKEDDSGEEFDFEVILRVVAVHEDRVWFKEYGKGHSLATIHQWKKRIEDSRIKKLVRGADHDAPF